MTAASSVRIEEAYARRVAGSQALYARALEYFPQGATRSARLLTGGPLAVDHGQGSRIWDVDGNEYIDYYVGLGSLVLGHGHPTVTRAIQDQAARGTQYGTAHAGEVRWAELICSLVPGAEAVRFTGSGSEATMLALRLARAATGRERILKLAGHYHGWYDYAVPATWEPYDRPLRGGVPLAALDTVRAVPAGDLGALRDHLSGGACAALILEPTGGKSGMFPLPPAFVAEARELCHRHGTLLIFDEVVTGFRCSPGGFQGATGIHADLVCLGKALGGGLPCGAVTTSRELLASVTAPADGARERMVYHSGTFNANPLSAAAGIAALGVIGTGAATATINRLAEQLRCDLNDLFVRRRLRLVAYGAYSMPHLALLPPPLPPGEEPTEQHLLPGTYQFWPRGLAARLSKAMLLEGIHIGRSIGMLSAAHTERDVEQTVEAYDRAIGRLLREGDLTPWHDG